MNESEVASDQDQESDEEDIDITLPFRKSPAEVDDWVVLLTGDTMLDLEPTAQHANAAGSRVHTQYMPSMEHYEGFVKQS